MQRLFRFTFALLLAYFLGAAPGSAQPLAKGTRLLGLDISLDETRDFGVALDAGLVAGIDAVGLTISWAESEVEPGVFDAPFLAAANATYPSRGLSVSLVINVVDTFFKRVPADLASTAFDDATVVARFNAFLEYVFSQIADLDVVSLSIGNETDIYFTFVEPAASGGYLSFFASARDRARALRPGLPVGSKLTFDGAVTSVLADIQDLIALSDGLLLTYYPSMRGERTDPPSVVHAHFGTLASMYPGKPIFVAETGWPTSPDLGSSEAIQAEFIGELFEAWDAHAEQVRLVKLHLLHERSPEEIADLLLIYGISDPGFAAFLSTLGLRTYAGEDKDGMRRLQVEAWLRGWAALLPTNAARIWRAYR